MITGSIVLALALCWLVRKVMRIIMLQRLCWLLLLWYFWCFCSHNRT